MATFWQVLTITSFALAGLSFLAAVFVFIYFKIPSVIGDLTGRTVAKEVKAIRAENREKDIRHRSRSITLTNAHEKNETEKSGASKESVYGRVITSSGQVPETDMLNIATDRLDKEVSENIVTASLSSETMVLTEELTAALGEVNGTTFLEEGTTLLSEAEETTVLSEYEGTTVLDSSDTSKPQGFVVTEEELLVGTKEVIV